MSDVTLERADEPTPGGIGWAIRQMGKGITVRRSVWGEESRLTLWKQVGHAEPVGPATYLGTPLLSVARAALVEYKITTEDARALDWVVVTP